MPIDKIIPRFLVSDKDERLLKEGAMTDALNVTISEDGDGTEGVLKNVKGTTAATAVSGSELTDGNSLTVVGQVSDPQRGFIYFFVADGADSTDGPENAIYQYNTSTDKYKIVLKRGYLDFSTTSFVKADVVNADFRRDGTVETILYFTDDNHPPRKINVDRAIEGDYDSISDNQLDYALQSIKAAPTTPPSFLFETDTTVEQNNFQENIFQFATQIIYKDGEESAISSYSKLAISQSSIFGGLENEDYGVQNYTQNVCSIRTNINKNFPDLSKVRLLARKGNDGAWFVVEEFDPKSSITRDVIGNQVKVYDAATQEYKFYNDRLGSPVDINTVNKTYDNVPLKARGQAVVGNRLMYSDYLEGFENASTEADVSLTVQYSEVSQGSSSLIASAYNTNVIFQNPTKPNIDIDLLGGDAFGSSATTATSIAAGTRIEFSFIFKPTFTATAASGNIIEFDAVEDDGFTETTGQLAATALTFDTLSTSSEVFRVSTFLSADKTVAQAADIIAGLVDEEEVTLRYTISSGSLTGTGISSTGFTNAVADVTFKFGEVTSATGAVVSLKPRITKISISDITFSVGQISFPGGGGAGTIFDCFDRPGISQNELTYSSVNTTYISSQVAIAETLGASPTFKSGASYSLGVVYYDKFGRHGFVNELGNIFVDHIATRSSSYGPASVEINFDDYAGHPSWADSYQIVSSESSVQSVFQYTAGGAYSERDASSSTNPRTLNTATKKIYVSLKTLDLYKKDKDFLRDYSYTKGDKLRVISRKSDDGTSIVYPTASDGTVIEFDVVGVVNLLNNDENPIHLDGGHTHSNDDGTNDPHSGTFVIIEAPAVAAQVDGTDGNPLEYVGYDWFQINGEDYSSTNTVSSVANYWNRETLFEIVTPRKSTSEKVYYEIGERRKIGDYKDASLGDHGPAFVVNGGDVHYRAIAARSPVYGSGWQDFVISGNTYEDEDPETWVYQPKYIEDQSVSDAFSSKSWDKGRAHVVFKNAAEVRKRNGITYSDAYAEDVANLSLSSFNASLANFDSLDGKFGAVEYIGSYNDDLVAIQENKLCLIPVNKNILEYASGNANVAVSTNILGQRRYSSGDYGTGGHPEAVLIQDNNVYFVDESRQAVCALTGGQLVPISEKGMSSFFEDFFTNNHTKYVSGYDPRDNTYYLTGLNGTDNEYKTVGYDAARGAWQSRYSFQPDFYSNQNNMLYSAKYVDAATDLLFHKHDNTTAYNTFYGGSASPSTVQVVSKLSPSRVKVFNAISYEGDSDKWEMSSGATTNLNQTSGVIHDAADITNTPKFIEKEGGYYAAMSKATDYKYYFVGTVAVGGASNSSSVVSLSDISRLDRLPFFTSGAAVFTSDDGETFVSSFLGGRTIVSFDLAEKTITLNSNALGAADNKKVYVQVQTNGDALRGNFAKITLTNSSPTKHELYCINTHITDSKSHHPLGQ